MLPTMQAHVRPKVMWIPLILVGSILYWSVALGLGGMSLSFLGGSAEEDLALPLPGQGEAGLVIGQGQLATSPEPIVVRLQSMSELHANGWSLDVRGTGGNGSSNDGTGRLPATDEDAPPPPPEDTIGRTSY
jgi:hypothetical protein